MIEKLRYLLWAGVVVAALAMPFALSGCAGLLGVQQAAEQVEKVSLPRARVATLARVLKASKEGLAAEWSAGKIGRDAFLGTEQAVVRAEQNLFQAGELLNSAQADYDLAASTTDALKQTQYKATGAAREAMAIDKSNAAEVDIMPLRTLLDGVRGIPPLK